MSLIESLQWRYATKRFDATKKVSAEHLAQLKQAIQLSASSYGLQLYKVLIIEDEALREQLKPAAWNQAQITEASAVIVFCTIKDMGDAQIDEYLQLKADTQGMSVADLKGYGDFMKKTIGAFPEEAKDQWMAKQTYIALGNLLAAAGELQIDACPMEGFEAAKFDEILGLEAKGLKSAVIATIGYRSAEDQTANAPKVRKPIEDLFETI